MIGTCYLSCTNNSGFKGGSKFDDPAPHRFCIEGTRLLCLILGFTTGLEIKVAFGGVWKQSLSELSGGQRSLLALSLILAMLLFKPAPIYILDEVSVSPTMLPGGN